MRGRRRFPVTRILTNRLGVLFEAVKQHFGQILSLRQPALERETPTHVNIISGARYHLVATSAPKQISLSVLVSELQKSPKRTLRHEAGFSAVGLSSLRRPRESKVTDFEVAVGVEKKVRRLEVAVDDVRRVKGLDRSEGLVREVLAAAGGDKRSDTPLNLDGTRKRETHWSSERFWVRITRCKSVSISSYPQPKRQLPGPLSTTPSGAARTDLDKVDLRETLERLWLDQVDNANDLVF